MIVPLCVFNPNYQLILTHCAAAMSHFDLSAVIMVDYSSINKVKSCSSGAGHMGNVVTHELSWFVAFPTTI